MYDAYVLLSYIYAFYTLHYILHFMLDIQKYIGSPKIIVDEQDNGITKFEIKFLPRGFGHTIGNAMRRVMLGYDLGASVTAMKIK